MRAVRGLQTRPAFFIAGLENSTSRTETVLAQRRVPREPAHVGFHDVRMAVAVEVDELEARFVPSNVRQLPEGAEGRPALVLCPFEESGCRTVEGDDVKVTVPGEVQEL